MLAANDTTAQALHVREADMEIRAHLAQKSVRIDIMKSGTKVHTLTIADAVNPLDNQWIAELFAREHKVSLATMAREMDDYIMDLDVNQG